MCQQFILEAESWVCVILYCLLWKTCVRPFSWADFPRISARLPEAAGHRDTVQFQTACDVTAHHILEKCRLLISHPIHRKVSGRRTFCSSASPAWGYLGSSVTLSGFGKCLLLSCSLCPTGSVYNSSICLIVSDSLSPLQQMKFQVVK